MKLKPKLFWAVIDRKGRYYGSHTPGGDIISLYENFEYASWLKKYIRGKGVVRVNVSGADDGEKT